MLYFFHNYELPSIEHQMHGRRDEEAYLDEAVQMIVEGIELVAGQNHNNVELQQNLDPTTPENNSVDNAQTESSTTATPITEEPVNPVAQQTTAPTITTEQHTDNRVPDERQSPRTTDANISHIQDIPSGRVGEHTVNNQQRAFTIEFFSGPNEPVTKHRVTLISNDEENELFPEDETDPQVMEMTRRLAQRLSAEDMFLSGSGNTPTNPTGIVTSNTRVVNSEDHPSPSVASAANSTDDVDFHYSSMQIRPELDVRVRPSSDVGLTATNSNDKTTQDEFSSNAAKIYAEQVYRQVQALSPNFGHRNSFPESKSTPSSIISKETDLNNASSSVADGDDNIGENEQISSQSFCDNVDEPSLLSQHFTSLPNQRVDKALLADTDSKAGLHGGEMECPASKN